MPGADKHYVEQGKHGQEGKQQMGRSWGNAKALVLRRGLHAKEATHPWTSPARVLAAAKQICFLARRGWPQASTCCRQQRGVSGIDDALRGLPLTST